MSIKDKRDMKFTLGIVALIVVFWLTPAFYSWAVTRIDAKFRNLDANGEVDTKKLNNVRMAHMYATGGTGSTSDPWTGWDTDANSDGTSDIVAANTRVHFATGCYSTSTGLLIEDVDGVAVTGDGHDNSIVRCTAAAGNCIYVNNDDGALSKAAFYVQGIRLEQTTNALTAGAAVLNINFSHIVTIRDMLVYNGGNNLAADGTAVKVTDINYARIDNLNIRGADSALWGVGADIANGVSDNRGNVAWTGGVLNRVKVGVRIANGASNLVNSIHLDGVKFVVKGATTPEGTIAGSIGVQMATQAEGITIENCHFERYEKAIEMTGADAVTITGNMFGTFNASTEGQIDILTAGNKIEIVGNRFGNSSAESTIGIKTAATADINSLSVIGNKFNNVNTPFSDSATGGARAYWTSAGTGHEFWFKDDIAVGDDIDAELKCITFPRPSGDRTLCYDGVTDNRFEFNAQVRSSAAVYAAANLKTDAFLQYPDKSEASISSGALAVTAGWHTVAGEGDVDDALTSITGGSIGDFLLLTRAGDDTITVTAGALLELGGGEALNYVMDDEDDFLLLFKVTSTVWREVSRSSWEALDRVSDDFVIEGGDLTIGDGTAKDLTLTFSPDTAAPYLKYVASTDGLQVYTGLVGVDIIVSQTTRATIDQTGLAIDGILSTTGALNATGGGVYENQVTYSQDSPASAAWRAYDADGSFALFTFLMSGDWEVEGTNDEFEIYWTWTDPTADRTIVVPDESGTVAISTGAYHDGFSDFVASEHLDWTASVGTIHADNYTDTNTTYTAGDFLTLTATDFDLDASAVMDTKCIWFEDPTDADDFQSIWTANGFAATITKMWCESDQTVNMDLQIGGSDVNGADLVCDATPAEDESMGGDATLADGQQLDLAITSTSGTPTWVSICWTYTVDAP